MQTSIQNPTAERPTPTETVAGASRLRTVTGNRFPRRCSCGCGGLIPRDSQLRYVVDFSGPKPFKTYLREHSPDFGTYRGGACAQTRPAGPELPGFVRASELPIQGAEAELSIEIEGTPDPAHSEADASRSPEAGRPWASGQLVFNAGQFESARSGFADYAKDGESPAQLRARVNRIILEDLEQKVLALRALHEKLRDRLEGPSFGDKVARARSA
jgi:hypothetical protein